MIRGLDRRLAELENGRMGGGRVVAVDLYDGETEDEAIAAHIAGGGEDPAGAGITVFLKAFMPRPARGGRQAR